jgi:hypothetical protein
MVAPHGAKTIRSDCFWRAGSAAARTRSGSLIQRFAQVGNEVGNVMNAHGVACVRDHAAPGVYHRLPRPLKKQTVMTVSFFSTHLYTPRNSAML